jgi:hypothetical protein
MSHGGVSRDGAWSGGGGRRRVDSTPRGTIDEVTPLDLPGHGAATRQTSRIQAKNYMPARRAACAARTRARSQRSRRGISLQRMLRSAVPVALQLTGRTSR